MLLNQKNNKWVDQHVSHSNQIIKHCKDILKSYTMSHKYMFCLTITLELVKDRIQKKKSEDTFCLFPP